MKWIFAGFEIFLSAAFFLGWYLTGSQFDLWISGFTAALTIAILLSPD